MQLFFHPQVYSDQQEVVFDREETRHIVKVLRKREGDTLHLTNGKGWLFETKLISAERNRCIAKIIRSQEQPAPTSYLHLAVAPTKMNDRYEWFLEKATEIGIQEITPIICDHSERTVVKQERFERVLQSALKQSLHTRFPVLNPSVSFLEFLDRSLEGQRFIAHCEDDLKKKLLSQQVQADSKVTILIGPEGDFSIREIKMALEKGWEAISLGHSRLRTETAAIVACHTTALINELTH